MIDVDNMEKYLDNRKNIKHFIGPGSYISSSQLEKLKQIAKKYGKTEFLKCITTDCKITQTGGEYGYILVDLPCDNCSCISRYSLSKTKFGDLLIPPKGEDYKKLCQSCTDHEKFIKKKEIFVYEHERQKKKLENTSEYIECYLTPEMEWKKGFHFKDQWNSISNLCEYSHDKNLVCEFAKNMPYTDFLKTLYWKTISNRKKYQCGFRCQLCNSTERLETHHRTYAIRGYELDNMKELTVLCNNCHGKHHKK